MQCPKCGNASIKPGQKYCMKCGCCFELSESKGFEKNSCPKCGEFILKPGQKFCRSCGEPLVWTSLEQTQNNGEKGLIRDAANFVRGAFRGGRQAVQQERRRQQEDRVRQEAERMGLEINIPVEDNANADAGRAPQHGSQPHVTRRMTVDTNSHEGVNVVNGRAIWNIEKGQLARLITETELANTDGLKGVIIQEGCTALVFIDGTLVANMEAGAYTFPAKSEAELKMEEVQREIEREQEELDKKQETLEAEQRKRDAEYARTFRARGIFGEIAALGRGVMGFLFGRKKGDNHLQHKKKTEQRAQKVNAIAFPKVCRVYIVSNRAINLVFNSRINESNEISFIPFKVRTKLVDIEVAVTMQLQIVSIHEFVTNYLTDQQSVSTHWLQQMLTPMVKQTLSQSLRNLDYQQEGLPDSLVNNLKTSIQQTLNEYLKGIEVIRVFEITDNSADFDRFRAVERELYATEKELGFLQRTNEFKNRLEQERNKAAINHASNEESLRQALQEINKDRLISEDEMAQFVIMLRAQKRLRDSKDLIDAAKLKEEEYEAISELKKCHLVKDDEVAALENTLSQGIIDRENVIEIMRVQALQKLEMACLIAEFELGDNRMEHNMANELRKAQHQGNLAAAQLSTKRLIDIYNDERNEFEWNRAFARRQQQEDYEFSRRQQQTELDWQDRLREHDLSRQDKFDDVDILERKAATARANMEAMKETELRELQEKNRSLEAIELSRIDAESKMTQEQIAAAHMKDIAELDAIGQAEMAKMMGSGKENELIQKQQQEQKELYEQMMKMQQQQGNLSQEMLVKMAQMMQQGMVGVGQQRLEEQQQRADEYREDAQRQQERIDHTVDQSLNYTTRAHQTDSQSFAQALGTSFRKAQENTLQQRSQPQEHAEPQTGIHYCPECGAEVFDDDLFCGECGHRM